MSNVVRLTIPRARPYYVVVRLVVGGLAARLDLSYEYLEDLQLALEGLLLNDDYALGDEVTVEMALDDDDVRLLVGPLDGRELRPALEEDAEGVVGVGLRRLLAAVVENVELEAHDGEEWARLEKRVRGPRPGRGS